MKTKLEIVVLSLFIPNLLLNWFIDVARAEQGPQAGRVVVDEVVASIQGEPVLESELRTASGVQGEPTANNTPRKRLLLEMLLEKEAERLGVVVDQNMIETYLSEVKRQNGVDGEQFIELLAAQGYTLDNYRKVVKKEIERTRIYALEVRPEVEVSEAEIDAYLAENQSVMPDAGSVAVIRYDMDCGTDITCSGEGLLSGASKLKTSLESGSVNQVGVQFNRKELGFLKPEDLRENMAEVVSSLKDGQVSEPELIDGRLSLFQVVGRIDQNGSMTGLMRDQVRSTLVNSRLPKAVENWLSKDLPMRYNLVLTKDLAGS